MTQFSFPRPSVAGIPCYAGGRLSLALSSRLVKKSSQPIICQIWSSIDNVLENIELWHRQSEGRCTTHGMLKGDRGLFSDSDPEHSHKIAGSRDRKTPPVRHLSCL